MTKLVVWGGLSGDLASHRHIHRGFYSTARKMGWNAVWVNDAPASRQAITDDCIVISADVWSSHIGEAVPGADYVLHNYDGSHPLCRGIEFDHLLRLQVWTNGAAGELLSPYRSFLQENHTLFQPWGCDLLPEEFLDPVYNPQSRDVAFVGAVWREMHNGQDLGNESLIYELKMLCADRGLRFRHLTQVSDAENVSAVREARIAPSFAGGWQVENNYLPCRAFKNPAYGALSVTNVPHMRELFGDSHPGGSSLEEQLDVALGMKRNESLEMIREQQRAVSRFTYRESLLAIEQSLAAIKC